MKYIFQVVLEYLNITIASNKNQYIPTFCVNIIVFINVL